MDEDLTLEKHLMLLSLKLHLQWKIMWVLVVALHPWENGFHHME